jgi:DNA-binding SARP family transcriptional activator/TolB-like protein/Tfp pilus assembly protein PilF
MALLALLAAAGDRGMSRDKLVAVLWPESGDERARHVLAQTLYAIRRELTDGVVVSTGGDLRLNPDAIASDRAEFASALARKDFATAVALYVGPFLDGFFITDAPEFERWADNERRVLAHQYREALERLARDAATRDDRSAAADWWRRAATAEPLDSRLALHAMKAFAAAGDRLSAIRHARVHETLLRQELDLPTDPAIRAFSDQLRSELGTEEGHAVAATAAEAPSLGRSYALPAPPLPIVTPTAFARFRSAANYMIAAGLTIGLLAGAYFWRAHRASAAPSLPVMAVGTIHDYAGPDSSGIVRALTDMVSTNLARLARVRVVSNARVYEVSGQMRRRDGVAPSLEDAARQAGATEVIEGSVFPRSGGGLRFDLRRVDLATGAVRGAYSMEGKDLFSLADLATARLANDLDVPGGSLRIADVTTSSLVAYRFYEEGLRVLYQEGDADRAHSLFLLALREDSTFAMAAFYVSRTSDADHAEYITRAAKMSEHASNRERLLIQAGWAEFFNDPRLAALAETLSVRYPAEPDGHYLLGNARFWAGDFTGAVGEYRAVMAMDSLGLRGQTARCRACDAHAGIFWSYIWADSLEAADATLHAMLDKTPRSAGAWIALADLLEYENRQADEYAAIRRANEVKPGTVDTLVRYAMMAIRAGRFVRADSLGRAGASSRSNDTRNEALWFLTISLRCQGRLRDAEAAARRMLASAPTYHDYLQHRAQVVFESGRYLEAARLFDSLAAHSPYPANVPSRNARQITWNLAHVATATAAAGDTARLAALADTMQRIGQQSYYGRDRVLHEYVRGLLYRARGDEATAVSAFRRAIYSPSMGYTRVNLELGRSLLTLGRPLEAVAAVRPAFHGSLEASNLYVTLTELHELMAQAFDAAAQPDSALAHYRYVAAAWRNADPQFKDRLQRARDRIMVLERARRQAVDGGR